MRIISGKYKGRMLKGFDIKGTRPTMDRVKESVFASIQDYVKNSIVLDLYAGSGNLGIEAVSNGCKTAYLVDNSKAAIDIINYNISMLNINNVHVIYGDSSKTLNNLLSDNIKFDIIFLDPPYNTDEIDKSLKFINNNLSILNNDALIICESEANIDYSKYDNLFIYKTKKYGQKHVNILKINK